jgi:hypothetical protein
MNRSFFLNVPHPNRKYKKNRLPYIDILLQLTFKSVQSAHSFHVPIDAIHSLGIFDKDFNPLFPPFCLISSKIFIKCLLTLAFKHLATRFLIRLSHRYFLSSNYSTKSLPHPSNNNQLSRNTHFCINFKQNASFFIKI